MGTRTWPGQRVTLGDAELTRGEGVPLRAGAELTRGGDTGGSRKRPWGARGAERADRLRSPACGPPPGSCCPRRGSPIHSHPSSPRPCPGAASAPRGAARLGPPVRPGSRRRVAVVGGGAPVSRRRRTNRRPRLAGEGAGSHAPGGCHGGAGHFWVPVCFFSIEHSGGGAGGHLSCGHGDSHPERGLDNRK